MQHLLLSDNYCHFPTTAAGCQCTSSTPDSGTSNFRCSQTYIAPAIGDSSDPGRRAVSGEAQGSC